MYLLSCMCTKNAWYCSCMTGMHTWSDVHVCPQNQPLCHSFAANMNTVTKSSGRMAVKACCAGRVADMLPFATQAYCSEHIQIHGKCSGGTATSLN